MKHTLSLVTALLMTFPAAFHDGSVPAQQAPNIVLVMADDASAQNVFDPTVRILPFFASVALTIAAELEHGRGQKPSV